MRSPTGRTVARTRPCTPIAASVTRSSWSTQLILRAESRSSIIERLDANRASQTERMPRASPDIRSRLTMPVGPPRPAARRPLPDRGIRPVARSLTAPRLALGSGKQSRSDCGSDSRPLSSGRSGLGLRTLDWRTIRRRDTVLRSGRETEPPPTTDRRPDRVSLLEPAPAGDLPTTKILLIPDPLRHDLSDPLDRAVLDISFHQVRRRESRDLLRHLAWRRPS